MLPLNMSHTKERLRHKLNLVNPFLSFLLMLSQPPFAMHLCTIENVGSAGVKLVQVTG